MARAESLRRLIVNADDFGRSPAINQAVIHAHRNGILTSASLMVNEEAAPEAVALARENPRLGVGLHLTLLCGRAALPPEQIPDLVNEYGEFGGDPVAAGFRYFTQRKLRPQLQAEIRVQFERFHATGLPLDHINGHLNLHLHPVIFPMVCAEAVRRRRAPLRLTRDLFWFNARLASGRWWYRASHAFIFAGLARWARPRLQREEIPHTHRVFGLLQNARVDEAYLTRLLPRLPRGDSELYSHPSPDEFRHEYDALVSPRVKRLVEQLGIQLIRYQDL